MKPLHKILALMSFVIFTGLFALVAFAADPAPALDTSITGLISAIKIGTLGGILIASVQLLKTDFVSGLIGAKINTKALPYVSLVLGIIMSVGQSLVAGKPWYVGVVEGGLAAIASNKLYDHYTGQ